MASSKPTLASDVRFGRFTSSCFKTFSSSDSKNLVILLTTLAFPDSSNFRQTKLDPSPNSPSDMNPRNLYPSFIFDFPIISISNTSWIFSFCVTILPPRVNTIAYGLLIFYGSHMYSFLILSTSTGQVRRFWKRTFTRLSNSRWNCHW